MTRKQVVSYTITCDVCGEEIPTSESDEVGRTFAVGGASYQVDTCTRHRQELREILDRLKVFVDAGSRQPTAGRRRTGSSASRAPRSRRATGGSTKSATRTPASQVAAIRAWALEQGHAVGDRGRIPGKIAAAYHEAGGANQVTAAAPKRRSRQAASTAE